MAETSQRASSLPQLGCIAMDGLIEADIYGAVNSTQIMGSYGQQSPSLLSQALSWRQRFVETGSMLQYPS